MTVAAGPAAAAAAISIFLPGKSQKRFTMKNRAIPLTFAASVAAEFAALACALLAPTETRRGRCGAGPTLLRGRRPVRRVVGRPRESLPINADGSATEVTNAGPLWARWRPSRWRASSSSGAVTLLDKSALAAGLL